nr:MAG TPA_asm: hypothetical protein [Caudoviricetes sp.]
MHHRHERVLLQLRLALVYSHTTTWIHPLIERAHRCVREMVMGMSKNSFLEFSSGGRFPCGYEPGSKYYTHTQIRKITTTFKLKANAPISCLCFNSHI